MVKGSLGYGFNAAGHRSFSFASSSATESRFLAQGFTQAQSRYLGQPYKEWGHHFFRREWRIDPAFSESRFNILKPKGITIGDFYELHFKVDRSFWGTRFPKDIGGSWSGREIGLKKYGTLGRMWHGSPRPLKLAAGGALAAGAAGAYMSSAEND